MQQPSHLDLDFLLSCVLSGCPYCRHFSISIIVAPNIFHPRIVYDDHALVQQPSHFDLDFYSHAYYRDVHTAVIFLSVSSSPQISSTLKSYMMTMPCTFLATSLSPQIYSTLKSYMMTAPLWSALLLLSLCLLISLS